MQVLGASAVSLMIKSTSKTSFKKENKSGVFRVVDLHGEYLPNLRIYF